MTTKRNAGMTLIEAAIALLVFALIAGPLFGAFSYSQKMNSRAMLQTLAVYMAQLVIEETYGMDEDDIKSLYVIGEQTEFTDDDLAAFGLYYIYEIEKDYNGINGLYHVKVTVGNELHNVLVTLEDIYDTQ